MGRSLAAPGQRGKVHDWARLRTSAAFLLVATAANASSCENSNSPLSSEPVSRPSNGFDYAAASSRLAAVDLTALCKPADAKRWQIGVSCYFLNDGTLDLDRLLPEGPDDSEIAACVRAAYAKVKIPAFEGDAVLITRTFAVYPPGEIPPLPQDAQAKAQAFNAAAARAHLRAVDLSALCKPTDAKTWNVEIDVQRNSKASELGHPSAVGAELAPTRSSN